MNLLFRQSTRFHPDWEISPRVFAFPVRRSAGTPRHPGAPARLPLLKTRLLREILQAGVTLRSARSLRKAANSAEAIAWETPYPLLVFPCLFDERAREIQAADATVLVS